MVAQRNVKRWHRRYGLQPHESTGSRAVANRTYDSLVISLRSG